MLKGSPQKAAFEFANFFADPKMNELYNMNLGSGPTRPVPRPTRCWRAGTSSRTNWRSTPTSRTSPISAR